MSKATSPAAAALPQPESTPLLAQERMFSFKDSRVQSGKAPNTVHAKKVASSRHFTRYVYFHSKQLSQRGIRHPGVDYFQLNSMIAGTEYVVYQEFAKQDDGSMHYEEIQDQRLRAILLEYGRILSAQVMDVQAYLELETLSIQTLKRASVENAMSRVNTLVDFWALNMMIVQHLLMKLGQKITSQSTPLVERMTVDLLKSDGGFNAFVGGLLIEELIDSFGTDGANAEYRLDLHRRMNKPRQDFFKKFTFVNPDIEMAMLSHVHHLQTLSKDSLVTPRPSTIPLPPDIDAPEAEIEGRLTSKEYRAQNTQYLMDGAQSLPDGWETIGNSRYWTELKDKPPKVIQDNNRRKHITIWLVLLRSLIYYLYYYGIVINFWRELKKDGIGRSFWLAAVFGLAPLSSFAWNWASNYLKQTPTSTTIIVLDC